jgi:hypothetical protein
VKSKRNIQLSAFVGLSFIYSIMHGLETKKKITCYIFIICNNIDNSEPSGTYIVQNISVGRISDEILYNFSTVTFLYLYIRVLETCRCI